MGEIYANNTKGKLAQPVGASDTVLELEPGHSLPALGAGDWFRLTLYRWEFWAEGVREYNHEVVKVTDVSSNMLTVARGFEGVARSFDAGTNVELRPTAGTIEAVRSEAAQGITDHEAAPDPHPQYTTSSEASAAASAEVSSHESAPDPHTQYMTGAETQDVLRPVRDGAAMGRLPGWDMSTSGGSEPATITHSKGTERLRLSITWGSAGSTDGMVTGVVYDYSDDSGATWTSLGSDAITYDVDGNVASITWS